MKSAMLYFMLFVRVALYVVLFGEILLAEQCWNRFIQHLDIFLSEITFYVSPCRDCFQPVCAWTVYSYHRRVRLFNPSLVEHKIHKHQYIHLECYKYE